MQNHRAQELCECRGGRPGLLFLINYCFCGRKATLQPKMINTPLLQPSSAEPHCGPEQAAQQCYYFRLLYFLNHSSNLIHPCINLILKPIDGARNVWFNLRLKFAFDVIELMECARLEFLHNLFTNHSQLSQQSKSQTVWFWCHRADGMRMFSVFLHNLFTDHSRLSQQSKSQTEPLSLSAVSTFGDWSSITMFSACPVV